MIKISQLNVPITLDCNLHCKYCFREFFQKPQALPALSEDMKEFLRNRSGGLVTLSGGEPLIHFDRVKEIFSYVPDSTGKSIITNGTLLTPEIVEYVNKNNIEILLSHDGVGTKFLRGVDVLQNKTICNLLHGVKKLRISSVATKFNTDVWENFFYIAKQLKRVDFGYFSGPFMDTEKTHYLIDGFDYDTYVDTLFQFTRSPYRIVVKKERKTKCIGFSVLLDGTICSNIDVSTCYGTIFDSFASCRDRLIEFGHMDYCLKTKCKHNDHCRFLPQGATEHSCKCRQMIMDRFYMPEYLNEVTEYVKQNLSDIEKKYGWDKKYLM